MRQQLEKSLKRQTVVGIIFLATSFFLPPPANLANSHFRGNIVKKGLFLNNSQAFAFTVSTPTSAATAVPSPTITSIPTLSPTPTAVFHPTIIKQGKRQQFIPENSNLDPLFAQYAAQFDVDKELLKRITYCESRYNPQARVGDYGGLFQFHPNTWARERQKHGWDPDPALRFNPQEAIKTAAAKIAGGGIGAWPRCSR